MTAETVLQKFLRKIYSEQLFLPAIIPIRIYQIHTYTLLTSSFQYTKF